MLRVAHMGWVGFAYTKVTVTHRWPVIVTQSQCIDKVMMT